MDWVGIIEQGSDEFDERQVMVMIWIMGSPWKGGDMSFRDTVRNKIWQQRGPAYFGLDFQEELDEDDTGNQ